MGPSIIYTAPPDHFSNDMHYYTNIFLPGYYTFSYSACFVVYCINSIRSYMYARENLNIITCYGANFFVMVLKGVKILKMKIKSVWVCV